MAFISIQTLSKHFQTLCKPFAKPMQMLFELFGNSFQMLCKLLSQGVQTPLKRFQTFDKLLPNAFKCFGNPFKSDSNFFRTLCKCRFGAFETPFGPN